MTNPAALPPLSIYVHIPWCIKKCPYCDFNSHGIDAANPALPELDYLHALAADLESELEFVAGRKIRSVFFGGGTPSLFSAVAIENIIELLGHYIGYETDAEITLEANPGTFESRKFADFFRAGVNRLSIGIQSFSPDQLNSLGRVHSAEEAIRAFHIARDSGFDNINLDLMHGLPNQTTHQAVADIEQAIALQPEHISWYELTIEPNTEFYKRPPRLPVEDELAEINHAGYELLHSAGYTRYETSAYCADGRISQHNQNYWQFGDYIGIGAGAHGKTTLPNGDIIRRNKTRLPRHYMDGGRTPQSIKVPRDQQGFEFLMNALRLIDGVPLELFSQRTQLSANAIDACLAPILRQGYVQIDDAQLRPTKKGVRFLNNCLMELM